MQKQQSQVVQEQKLILEKRTSAKRINDVPQRERSILKHMKVSKNKLKIDASGAKQIQEVFKNGDPTELYYDLSAFRHLSFSKVSEKPKSERILKIIVFCDLSNIRTLVVDTTVQSFQFLQFMNTDNLRRLSVNFMKRHSSVSSKCLVKCKFPLLQESYYYPQHFIKDQENLSRFYSHKRVKNIAICPKQTTEHDSVYFRFQFVAKYVKYWLPNLQYIQFIWDRYKGVEVDCQKKKRVLQECFITATVKMPRKVPY